MSHQNHPMSCPLQDPTPGSKFHAVTWVEFKSQVSSILLPHHLSPAEAWSHHLCTQEPNHNTKSVAWKPRGGGLCYEDSGEMPANPKVQSTDSPGLPWVPRCPNKAWYLIWHSQELCFQGRLQEFPCQVEDPGRSRQSPSVGCCRAGFLPQSLAWPHSCL